MASTGPILTMLGERKTRASARTTGAVIDKENCPPVATPIGKGTAPAEGKTPSAYLTTSADKTGEAPKTFEQWDPILRSLPNFTASDRVRLDKHFERVLGSGNEELKFASHKDKDTCVALWLYRIALDPDEGIRYTKLLKWGIGRKYAVVYVQQVSSTLLILPLPHLLFVRHSPGSRTPCLNACSATMSTSLT